jgi:hypothetical protein
MGMGVKIIHVTGAGTQAMGIWELGAGEDSGN